MLRAGRSSFRAARRLGTESQNIPAMLPHLESIPSPIGNLLAVADDVTLHALFFEGREEQVARWLRTHHPDAKLREGRDVLGIRDRLDRYFSGDFAAFDGLHLSPTGSAFQQSVWEILRAIPPGTTTTYGTIANQLGSPKLARAVGLANGANPIPIVIPCHRVIGTNGKLTGFGGGMPRKTWLLRHEGVLLTEY
jgi:methylated-DNA-[protein]-cysteine S-methyltransferase